MDLRTPCRIKRQGVGTNQFFQYGFFHPLTSVSTQHGMGHYGADVEEEEAERLLGRVNERFPGVDVELQYGGQPVYSYIVSAE